MTSVNVPKSNIDYIKPKEIDTSKEKQILIVPDPEIFPDLNGAILENWDMVSNPEKWLEEHPEHDPTPEKPKPEVPEIPIPKPEPVIPEVPQPKYIPNPEYVPELLPSIENPKYIPNPNYNPDKPPLADPTGKQHFDPVTGEDKGVQDVPIIDLQSFFLAIKTHFDNKYPIFTDLYNMYKIECEVCNNWKGLSASGITIGGEKFSEIVIVDSSYVNAVAPKIKIWISGVIWFFLGLYLIKRMSTVWGSGK
ncbi:hypothetical protein P9265_07560 [Schinkia azotoformans]|uniref:hypothetical protein n=1 Tax=Schinkia azotoformans TaxID=1454 RepID=UPI002E1D28BD|nr:hypothetical protein [Schinkia azotoformans]